MLLWLNTFLSSNIVDLLPRHRVWAYPSSVSDHYSVILEWMEPSASCSFPFKFNHFWLSNDDFVILVREAWPQLSQGSSTSGMEEFSLKLRLLKEKVKSWTRDKTLEMKDKSILIEDEINFILNSPSSSLLSLQINDRLLSLRAELKKLRDHELQSARLQSRMIWASLGDANTKFFHLVASARKNQNSI